MGYDRRAPKRPVNMSLNEDLVRQARALTPNLSETVETLLAGFVEAEAAKRAGRERQIAAYIAASNAVIEKYGSAADEFGGTL